MSKNFFLFTLCIVFLSSCSLDKKTGIWTDEKEEQKKIAELKKKKKLIIGTDKIYSSEITYSKELDLRNLISVSQPKRNTSWTMPSLNHQNYMNNLFLSGVNNIFLKKKIGKNKFSESKNITNILAYKESIIFSDDNGTIYNINKNGKINWKKNIYNKNYKNIYKSLILSMYKKSIYIADNIGFIYSIDLLTGKLIWIKDHSISIKSSIKVFKNKIIVIDQDNKILCLSTVDGTRVWDILSISSFIKSPTLLPIAISNIGHILTINSSGDIFKINIETGTILWSSNTSLSDYSDASDFFRTSNIVIDKNKAFVSSGMFTFSYNTDDGTINWETLVTSIATPIIVNNNIFLVSEDGYFVILNKKSGKIISSVNLLKNLKKRKKNTKIISFIMGSGKIYSITANGYLIVSSSSTGKYEFHIKVGESVSAPMIINNNELYLLTKSSKILGFN